MTSAAAPGKIILCGEHAVVYGYPAVAIPLTQVEARVTVEPQDEAGVTLILEDIGVSVDPFVEEGESHPLVEAVRAVAAYFGRTQLPPLTITLKSSIPIASGLGSGAASAAAIIRALLQHLGDPATDTLVSDLTYSVEKHFHGTPSGIDNAVVSYQQPVYFMRRQPENLIETFSVQTPLQFLVADTGIRSQTKIVVSDVRQMWQASVARYDGLFERCGVLAYEARAAIACGDQAKLGLLMRENQEILAVMGVSSAEIDTLTKAAVKAGALGAKLSGAGRGGNIIALVTAETLPPVTAALINAGAKSVLTTILT